MSEYLKIFDENNNDLGKIEERKKVHELGLWHREIQVWIVNENGEVLIQRRAAQKKLGANKWSLTAGHVPSNESLVEGALREVEEEVGIKNITADDLKFFTIIKTSSAYPERNVINNHYKYCYVLRTNYKINEFILQEEEVSEVKYVTIEYLKNLTDEEKEEYTRIFKNPEFKDILEALEEKIKDFEEE